MGRRTSITTPNDIKTNYSYDVMDRLVEVTQNSDVVAEYEYDANSQLVSNIRNDITTSYEYNELGQLTELVNSDVNSELQTFTYQYDAIGNIVEEVRVEENQTNNRTYAYDAANQLVEFTDNGYMEAYTYDDVGNMLEKTINSTATNYSYNNGNQLVLEVTNGQAIGYTYNDNGDLTYKTTGEQYSYDIQGNLTSIVGNGIDKQYTYNGNGNRLSETTDGETIYYVNDINRRYEEVLQTYDEDGVVDTFTYGLQRIDSKGQTTETYLYDGRGSVTGTVGIDNSFASYSYTAYGELMPNSPEPTVFGYNAEATDFDTGMQYLRARYYDTGVQRFVQEDDYKGKYTRPSSMNRYGYTEGNPVMGTDPSGYALNQSVQQEILLGGRKGGSLISKALPQIIKPKQKGTNYAISDTNTGMSAKDHELQDLLDERLAENQKILERAEESKADAVESAKAAAMQESYMCAMAAQQDSLQEEEETKWWQSDIVKTALVTTVAIVAVVAVIATAGAATPLVMLAAGAAGGLAATATSDLLDDGQLNTDLKTYVGATVGGAIAGVGGAAVAAAGLPFLSAVGAMLTVGALADSTNQLISTGTVNIKQSLIVGGISAFFYGASTALTNVSSSSASVVSNSIDDPLYGGMLDEGFSGSIDDGLQGSLDDGLQGSLDDGFDDGVAFNSTENRTVQSAAVVAEMNQGNTPSIGKMVDLNNPGSVVNGEFKVADYLPNQGSPQSNWQQNSGVLRTIMNYG